MLSSVSKIKSFDKTHKNPHYQIQKFDYIRNQRLVIQHCQTTASFEFTPGDFQKIKQKNFATLAEFSIQLIEVFIRCPS